jgi:hypothetical protein
MTAPILNAIRSGFSSNQVLNHIKRQYPQYINAINTAQLAGYTSNVILKKIADKKSTDANAEEYLTEHEQSLRNDKRNRSKAAMQLGGILATAIGGGLYAKYLSNARAIVPQVITQNLPGRIPPRPGAGPTINITPPGPRPGTPGQLPGRQQPQLTQQAPQLQRGAPQPSPQNQPPQRPHRAGVNPPSVITPQYEHDPQTNVNLIKNIKEDKRIAQTLASGLAPVAILQILRDTIPKGKQAIMDRAPGGFDQAILDFASHHQHEIAQISKQKALEQFNQKIRPPTIAAQEEKRFNEVYPPTILPSQQEQQQTEQLPEPQIQAQPEEQVKQQTPIVPPIVARKEEPLKAAFGAEKPKSLSEFKPLSETSFSIPNYRYANESDEDYHNRNILYGAVEKAARALMEGKSFLDFPNPFKDEPGTKYSKSVAADVLRFLAGIDNVYDATLEPEEKEEMFNGLMESGKLTEPGLAPSPLEGDVYGAQITPNLIWNLLLSVEPRIGKMEKPPSIKGYKTAPGGKMGTTEIRRFLTHAVYGFLSGKAINLELANKINKISSVTKSMDVIANATRDGNARKIQEEMDKMSDAELAALYDIDMDELILNAQGKELRKQREEEVKSFEKTVNRQEGAKKAAATRKAKKDLLNED